MVGAPGGLAHGPRLPGRVRAQAQRPIRVDPAVPPVPDPVRGLPPAASPAPSRPARAGRLRRLARVLQPGRDRGVGAARLPRPALSARAGALGGLPSARAGRAAGALRAAHVAGDHARLLGDVPCRPQHRRLERDRRRLRRRDRSRPDRRRRPALRRGVLGGRREGRHLRPGQLPALRALRAGAALERGMGRSARRPRRRDRLRPAGARRSAAARPGAAAGARGQGARGGARLRLGRLPLHRLRARDELERHARGARVHRRPARLCVAVGCAQRYRDGARRGIQVRSARAGPAVRAPLTGRLRGGARADAARRRAPVRCRLRPA